MSRLTITPEPSMVVHVEVESAPALEIQLSPAFNLTMSTVGLQGPSGPQGDGIQADPGDFTLLFENQLI